MDDVLTYTLKAGKKNSNPYYEDIADLANRWSVRALDQSGKLIHAFQIHLQDAGQPDRSPLELAFELLALGVTLREHYKQMLQQPVWTLRAQQALLNGQNRHPRLEAIYKQLRGGLNRLARGKAGPPLLPQDAAELDLATAGPRLLAWLRANGEETQARRLSEWTGWLAWQDQMAAQAALRAILELAASFEQQSQAILGKYTRGLAGFHKRDPLRRRWRHDAELLERTRLEYELGMLGTEVLNRVHRHHFLEAKRKIVIVPPCMRRMRDACQAIDTPYGARCQACNATCAVHTISRLGEKKGFDVYIMPDDLAKLADPPGSQSMPNELAKQDGVSTGVLGVACALMNWKGAWDLEALGLAGQGVLLEFAGCKNHWTHDGVVTATNLEQIAQVIVKQPGSKARS